MFDGFLLPLLNQDALIMHIKLTSIHIYNICILYTFIAKIFCSYWWLSVLKNFCCFTHVILTELRKYRLQLIIPAGSSSWLLPTTQVGTQSIWALEWINTMFLGSLKDGWHCTNVFEHSHVPVLQFCCWVAAFSRHVATRHWHLNCLGLLQNPYVPN